jgi:hypothetical protein
MARHRKWWSVPLAIGGIQTCMLASYHFVLPTHMQWDRGIGDLVPALVWALYALNFFWSLLALLTGILVVRAALRGPTDDTFTRNTIFVLGLYWLIHGAYTWVNPLPMPRSMATLKYVLLAFPALTAALHWLPLLLFREVQIELRAKVL